MQLSSCVFYTYITSSYVSTLKFECLSKFNFYSSPVFEKQNKKAFKTNRAYHFHKLS